MDAADYAWPAADYAGRTLLATDFAVEYRSAAGVFSPAAGCGHLIRYPVCKGGIRGVCRRSGSWLFCRFVDFAHINL